MALVSSCKCEHPKLFFNKYTGEEIFVSCGKCLPCRRAYRSAWTSKLINEAKCHLYSFEVELDYDDAYLPKYDFDYNDPDFLIENTPRLENYYKKYPHLKKIPINELKFDHKSDFHYFVDRINTHHTCIPHASVYDIQLFKKRLNTIICRECSGKFSNFRSAFVSELGSTTLRPHYHGILYFDNPKLLELAKDRNGEQVILFDKRHKPYQATYLDWFVDRSWRGKDSASFGHARVAPSRGKLASYIAKYLCKFDDIPSFYAHPGLRNIFLTSRKPALGSLCESKAEIRQIFFGASPRRVEFTREGELWCPKVFPIGKSIENRLFPKCLSYDKISRFDRDQLYRIAHFQKGFCPTYSLFMKCLLPRLFDGLTLSQVIKKYPGKKTLFDKYQMALVHGLVWWKRFNVNLENFQSTPLPLLIKKVSRDFETERTFISLYSTSSRVFWQSDVFGISPEEYLLYVYKYHDVNKPQFLLRNFYNTQINVLKRFKDYDQRFFYPLSYSKAGYYPAVAPDALAYQKEIHFKYDQEMKNHFKNDYFEKLKYKDDKLYKLLKTYYAQKCNENAQAESNAWA